MAVPLLQTGFFVIVLALLVHDASGYDSPSSFTHTFTTGEEIYAKVNSLTSIHTLLPFSYYSLPYCKPPSGIKRSDQNIGESLVGDQILNSPYRFRMNVNESLYLCTTHPLKKNEVRLLKERIQNSYRVNMLLDNLPIMKYSDGSRESSQLTGFPVGYNSESSYGDYIINHLKFRILVHESSSETIRVMEGGRGRISEASTFEIVGFQVTPCSVRHDPQKMRTLDKFDPVAPVDCPLEFHKSQVLLEQQSVSFTYEVEFVKSDLKWSSRWDDYLEMGDVHIHWFSIINLLITIVFLTSLIFMAFSRAIRRSLSGHKEVDEVQSQVIEEIPGWKLLMSDDVFREPSYSRLLCVMVGNGVQITGMAIIATILAALGFIPLDSRGMLLTGMIILYHIMGFGAGYCSVQLWRTVKGNSEGWLLISLSTSLFFPGIVCLIHIVLNLIFWRNKSTSALPFYMHLILASLWFFVSVPLTLLGGFIAKPAKQIHYPVYVNLFPNETRAWNYPSWPVVIGMGTLPFITLYMELSFILSSFFTGRFCYIFEVLVIVLILLIIVSAQVSVLVTIMNLRACDSQCWWKAFYASGSSAFYIFVYFTNYLVSYLQGLSGLVSVTIYIGYSLIIVMGIMLSLGSVGFLASFYFVHFLFRSTSRKAVPSYRPVGEGSP